MSATISDTRYIITSERYSAHFQSDRNISEGIKIAIISNDMTDQSILIKRRTSRDRFQTSAYDSLNSHRKTED